MGKLPVLINSSCCLFASVLDDSILFYLSCQIDKDGASPERVMQELSSIGLMPEDWGGDIPMVQVFILYFFSFFFPILLFFFCFSRVLTFSFFLNRLAHSKGRI